MSLDGTVQAPAFCLAESIGTVTGGAAGVPCGGVMAFIFGSI